MPNNQSEERHRVALVTGCSEPDSLGVATVQHLHKRGWRVIATARRIETMQALKASGIEVSSQQGSCFGVVGTDDRR